MQYAQGRNDVNFAAVPHNGDPAGHAYFMMTSRVNVLRRHGFYVNHTGIR